MHEILCWKNKISEYFLFSINKNIYTLWDWILSHLTLNLGLTISLLHNWKIPKELYMAFFVVHEIWWKYKIRRYTTMSLKVAQAYSTSGNWDVDNSAIAKRSHWYAIRYWFCNLWHYEDIRVQDMPHIQIHLILSLAVKRQKLIHQEILKYHSFICHGTYASPYNMFGKCYHSEPFYIELC